MGDQAAAKRKAKAIVDLSRVWFKKSLGLRMDIDIEVLTNKFYDGRISSASVAQINALQDQGRQGDEDEHPTAWITAGSSQWGISGIANVPGICRGISHGPLFPLSMSFIFQ